MNPKIAVLMCAYNSEVFIKEAIESILEQTYSDFEFIIVENGSTDRTWEIIKSYGDSRIKPFKTEIKGLTFNLNYGLLQTEAEFIARMDTDDIANPERLEKQISYLEIHPEVSVLGTAIEIFNNSKMSRVVILPLTDSAIRRRLPFVFSFCHPSVMFYRRVIMNVGGYDGIKGCEDLDLWLRLMRNKSIKFANLPEPLLKYRIHLNQIKGSRESYIASTSVLFREALFQRSFRLFVASVVAFCKTIMAVKKMNHK